MRSLFVPLVILSAASCPSAWAEEPFGWIHSGHSNAYALTAGDFELSGNLAAVNDSLDVLDLRERLLNNNQRLIGNSGDLSGRSGELRLGVWNTLELFYRQRDQRLRINLAAVSSADIENLDNELVTQQEAFGAKWVFFEALNTDRSYPWTSAALELTRSRSHSSDFGGDLAALRTSASGGVIFDPPSRFALDRLQDDSWQARFLFSTALGADTTATAWVGYGETQSSSGTRWDVDISFLRDAFLQTFDTTESQYTLGANLNWQVYPRLPIQIGYEFINIFEREQRVVRSSGRFSRYLPPFLRGDTLIDSETSNHTLYGTVSWWLTPQLFISAGGRLFSSQFTGIIPHYNNPLSGNFSAIPYGYAQLQLGFRFSKTR